MYICIVTADVEGLETEMEAFDHMNPVIVERIRARFGEGALPRDEKRR